MRMVLDYNLCLRAEPGDESLAPARTAPFRCPVCPSPLEYSGALGFWLPDEAYPFRLSGVPRCNNHSKEGREVEMEQVGPWR